MAQYEHLPIYRKAFDLLLWIENAVRGFSRCHKYTIGSDLRNAARAVVKRIIRANQVHGRRSRISINDDFSQACPEGTVR